jgi:hypothetical protein
MKLPKKRLYNLSVTILHNLKLLKVMERNWPLRLLGNFKNQKMHDIACGVGHSSKIAKSGHEAFGMGSQVWLKPRFIDFDCSCRSNRKFNDYSVF